MTINHYAGLTDRRKKIKLSTSCILKGLAETQIRENEVQASCFCVVIRKFIPHAKSLLVFVTEYFLVPHQHRERLGKENTSDFPVNSAIFFSNPKNSFLLALSLTLAHGGPAVDIDTSVMCVYSEGQQTLKFKCEEVFSA